ncbi:pirin family protein [Massilia sp. TS11]|uniref:pirin family protein n=1 Tax=Massilia sp. TS11 TaxID=2908003 RepID=UPI001EDBFC3F|nr:pirin family protein [Massilia sp. TS11]MCG2584519.1 pirin family protein [Massilia sp. TS11]
MTQILPAHSKDLGGGFLVRRLLPAAQRQAVGPFIFFDHFGPLAVAPEANHDVRPHPHIGLATVTYLFEGAIEHRDSVGSVQLIEPGAINWMHAGRGIVHSERTPAALRGQARRSHGLQLWCALPRAEEDSAPWFAHTPARAIPEWRADGARVRVLVGAAFGLRSPVRCSHPTLYLDIALAPGAGLVLEDLPAEAAVYPVAGDVGCDGEALAPAQMLVLDSGAPHVLTSDAGGRCVLIGGAPLDGPRYLYWNFVASERARLRQAAEDWEAQRFPPVPGETEWIPLPEQRPRD